MGGQPTPLREPDERALHTDVSGIRSQCVEQRRYLLDAVIRYAALTHGTRHCQLSQSQQQTTPSATTPKPPASEYIETAPQSHPQWPTCRSTLPSPWQRASSPEAHRQLLPP